MSTVQVKLLSWRLCITGTKTSLPLEKKLAPRLSDMNIQSKSSEWLSREEASDADRAALVKEVNMLRAVIEDLSEQRESDRRSILILQSQIDNIRDVKCSDSFESALRNFSSICSSLWNRVPSIPIEDIIHNLRRRAKKKSGKVSSKSSVTSKKAATARSTLSKKPKDSKESVFQLNNSLPRGT